MSQSNLPMMEEMVYKVYTDDFIKEGVRKTGTIAVKTLVLKSWLNELDLVEGKDYVFDDFAEIAFGLSIYKYPRSISFYNEQDAVAFRLKTGL